MPQHLEWIDEYERKKVCGVVEYDDYGAEIIDVVEADTAQDSLRLAIIFHDSHLTSFDAREDKCDSMADEWARWLRRQERLT